MKKILLFLLIVVLILQNVSAQNGGFTLNGKMQGLADGQKIILTPGATRLCETPVYKATVKNGAFTFTGKLNEPRLFILGVEGINTKGVEIFIENTTIEVTANVVIEPFRGEPLASFQNMKVTGSPSHDYFLKNIKVKNELDDYEKELIKKKQMVIDSFAKSSKDPVENKRLKALLLQTMADNITAFEAKQVSTYKYLFENNATTFWGPFFMMYFKTESIDAAEKSVFLTLSDKVKNSYYGNLLNNELFGSFIGKDAPAFLLPDRNGKKFALKNLLGEYTIIDFWASWCIPCRYEIPNVKKLYEKYHSKGLEVVSISSDMKDANWIKALDEEKMPWTNLLADKEQQTAKKYYIRAIPAIFLVDKNGKIIGEKLHGELLAEKLKALFGE